MLSGLVPDDSQTRLLRELVLSGAPDKVLRAEGFTTVEIAAMKVRLAAREVRRSSKASSKRPQGLEILETPT